MVGQGIGEITKKYPTSVVQVAMKGNSVEKGIFCLFDLSKLRNHFCNLTLKEDLELS